MLLTISLVHFAKSLTEISDRRIMMVLPLLLPLSFGTLFFTAWTETTLRMYAQLLQPSTKHAPIILNTRQIFHYQTTHSKKTTTFLAKG